MKINTWSFQHQGAAPIQEDVVWHQEQFKFWMVLDGFGGSTGLKAAQIVQEACVEFMQHECGDFEATLPFEIRRYYSLAGNVIYNAVAYANKKLFEAMKGAPWENCGGASAIIAYQEGQRLTFGSVGACRLYLHRQGKVQKLSHPKTLATWMSPDGNLEATDYEVPLMYFGSAQQLEPEINEIRIQSNDEILLETSGVNDVLRTEVLVHGARQILHHEGRNASGILVQFNE